jgi:small-conductance mechanosensitive channel
MRIETVSARDRIRFYVLLGVVHSASAQMTEILSGIGRLLGSHPLIVTDTISVRLVAFTDSALNIEVSALCETTNYDEFLAARQSLLLGIMAAVERAGSALSHPVQTIALAPGAKLDASVPDN